MFNPENYATLTGKGTDGPLIGIKSCTISPDQARSLGRRLLNLADEGEKAMPVVAHMMDIMEEDGESMETMAIALFRAGYRKQT